MPNNSTYDAILREAKQRIYEMVMLCERSGVSRKCPWGDEELDIPFEFHTGPHETHRSSEKCRSCREAMGYSDATCPCLYYRSDKEGFDKQLDRIIQEVASGDAIR